MAADELKLWRVRIRTRGASLSAWQADTLWGHLCWCKRDLQGESALESWINRYRDGTPPLLVSDGFPGDTLPRPMFAQAPARKHRRVRWLTRQDFLATRSAGELVVTAPAARWDEAIRVKNTVSRNTWSSLSDTGSGGLFMLREARAPHGVVTVYVRVAEDERAEAEALFGQLAQTGFGKRRSIGYGAVEPEPVWEPEPELGVPPPGANGWVTLSSFIPASTDPVDGCWDLRVKHGKFGDELGPDPWKVPLLYLATGSTFHDNPGRLWAGGIEERIDAPVKGLDPKLAAIRRQAVQYALGFPIPIKVVVP